MTIDTHVHLDAAAFADDLDAVLRRATDAGVARLISIGTDLASSQRAVALTERFAGVYATLGVHPHEAETCPTGLEQEFTSLAASSRVVAIGETGLDYYRNHSAPNAQRAAFRRQIALAAALGLPLVIHCRAAETETVAILADAGAANVVMHCFTGSWSLARECLDRGWYLAFGGAVTYPRNAELRAVVRDVPADRLLFETDAPYLAPAPHRGKRNEPAWVTATIACCAMVRGASAEALAERAEQNAAKAFPRLVGV